MDQPHSTISDTLGMSVFGLLAGLSAFSFLIAHLSDRIEDTPGATLSPTVPAVEKVTAVEPLKAQIQEVTKARDSLQRELDALREKQDDAIEALKREKESLAKELTATEAERDAIQASLAERQSQIDGFAQEKAEFATLRASTRGEVDRLKSELQAAKRKNEDDAKSWQVAKAGLEASSKNLAQQNELLKNRLAEGMKPGLPDSGDNAAAALNLNEAVIAKLRDQIVALEQKLDALGIQRNELTRALRSAREASAAGTLAPPQGPEPDR